MTEDEKNMAQNPFENEEIIEGEIMEEGAGNVADETTAAISEEQYQQMSQDLEKAEAKAKEYLDSFQRERADFMNYRRRIERDQQSMAQNMTGEIIKKYLAVVDDLERALKARPTEGAAATWSDGIELIYRKLQNILEAEGVKRMPAETEDFNPNRHEAISYEENPDHESGEIIEVVQQGYTLGDRVLRPALVRVAR